MFLFYLKTFPSSEVMMQQTKDSSEGTLSFTTGTGKLYIRVQQGWKEVLVQQHLWSLSSMSL